MQAALTGDQAAITKAGNDLLGVAAFGGQKAQDAIKGYIGKVATETPYGYVIADRLKNNPALASQLPTFGGFKDKVVGGLTSMGPRALFPGVDPMRDAPGAAS